MTKNKFEWLNEGHEFAEVTHHRNRGKELSDEDFDEWLLSTYGYEKDDTVHYSIKTGKTTLGGNPFMDKDI